MGKNLKGKECGKGIFQRKDGWYIARFVDKYGTRHEKYFKTLAEARNWQADSQYQDRHGSIAVPVNMTVDAWFEYWIQTIVLENRRPAKNSSYDAHLYKLCDEAGIERFCMHALRHTYATRAIESGMQPKVLQNCWVTPASKPPWIGTFT